MKKTDTHVLIVTYNSKTFIKDCINSLLGSDNAQITISVIDNSSTDGTVDFIEQNYPSVRVLKNTENLGYAIAINNGFEGTAEEFLIIANADVIFERDSISKLTTYLAEHPNVGIVGPQQVFPNNKWQRSYGNVPGFSDSIKNLIGITTVQNMLRRCLWPLKIDSRPRKVGYIDGAVMAVRRKAYDDIGDCDSNVFF